MEETNGSDVLVIAGGPAGSTIASLLARAVVAGGGHSPGAGLPALADGETVQTPD
jgi:hypothetical protein